MAYFALIWCQNSQKEMFSTGNSYVNNPSRQLNNLDSQPKCLAHHFPTKYFFHSTVPIRQTEHITDSVHTTTQRKNTQYQTVITSHIRVSSVKPFKIV